MALPWGRTPGADLGTARHPREVSAALSLGSDQGLTLSHKKTTEWGEQVRPLSGLVP